jgi:hypothetical protein
MNPTTNTKVALGKQLTRAEVIKILNSAMQVDEFRFTRRVATHWLDTFPGDLFIEYIHARALIGDDRADLAIPILKKIINVDPEFLEAQKLLAENADSSTYSTAADAYACVHALGGDCSEKENIQSWGLQLAKARTSISNRDSKEAEINIQNALMVDPPTPIAAIMHLRLAIEYYDWMAIRSLTDLYFNRWPDSLVCNLVMAAMLIESGEEDRAVSILHQCAAHDVSGQVPTRLWGANHPFQRLWSNDLEIFLDFPIPASVSSLLGLNQLEQGPLKTSSPSMEKAPNRKQSHDQLLSKDKCQKKPPSSNVPETLIDVQQELERVANSLKKPQLTRADGRFPVYVVLTTRHGLEKKYGKQNLSLIEASINDVLFNTRKYYQWGAILLYADDLDCTSKYGLKPAKPKDPWSIKNLLADLDKALVGRGEMIAALLIVGGPTVVPFHHLPNPIDDADIDVPSDNPYATSDQNYFIPDWPVGRIPGGETSDPAQLIANLKRIVNQRARGTQSEPWYKRWWEKILSRISSRRKMKQSFGYTAEIWQRASHSVFRPIGEPRSLVISPPTQADFLSRKGKKPVHLGYYNLHGLEDSSDWYGQRDPIETPYGPDFPIALRPKDVVNSGRAPHVVFTEACYGGHIIGKTNDSAIALKFLASGSQAVVGSTCISYGSINPPLIAADLLGKAFWKYLQEGYYVGDALRRAKVHMAREMHRRQGYLDGEDQKTLISFVLYGDPLAKPILSRVIGKNILRNKFNTLNVKTICDRNDGNQTLVSDIPEEVMHHVKQVVKTYLPGMSDAVLTYSLEHSECQGDECLNQRLNNKSKPAKRPNRQLVTLSKQIIQETNMHQRYARITLDKHGKVVKVAVSR